MPINPTRDIRPIALNLRADGGVVGAKHTVAKPSAESGCWAYFPRNPLLDFLDFFFFYFFCLRGIELFVIAESPASA
jgi:hypothetical protein